MKTKIELTSQELKITMSALHLFRSIAESLHLHKLIKIGEMNLTEIEKTRMIFANRFYDLDKN